MKNYENPYLNLRGFFWIGLLLIITFAVGFLLGRYFFCESFLDRESYWEALDNGLPALTDKTLALDRQIESIYSNLLDDSSIDVKNVQDSILNAEQYLNQISNLEDNPLLAQFVKTLKSRYVMEIFHLKRMASVLPCKFEVGEKGEKDCISQKKQLQSDLTRIQSSWNNWWIRNNSNPNVELVRELTFKFDEYGKVDKFLLRRKGTVGYGDICLDKKGFIDLGMEFK